MGVFDKLIDAVKINDDIEENGFYDEEDDYEEEAEEKPKKGFFSRLFGNYDDDEYDEDEDEEDDIPVTEKKPAFRSKAASNRITPMRRRNGKDMEVRVIKPVNMEETKEIADTLISNRTVVLNLEGLDVEIAQRIIDFSSGACYTINGSLQKVSSYIFILTPMNVGISGDITDVINGSIPNMRNL